jgi:hypothetical protein
MFPLDPFGVNDVWRTCRHLRSCGVTLPFREDILGAELQGWLTRDMIKVEGLTS